MNVEIFITLDEWINIHFVFAANIKTEPVGYKPTVAFDNEMAWVIYAHMRELLSEDIHNYVYEILMDTEFQHHMRTIEALR